MGHRVMEEHNEQHEIWTNYVYILYILALNLTAPGKYTYNYLSSQ